MEKKIESLLNLMNTQQQTLADPWGAMIDDMLMRAKIKYLTLQALIERLLEIIKPRPEPWPEYVKEGILMILERGLKTDTKKDMEQALKHENTLLIIDPNKLNAQEITTLMRLLMY